MMQTGAGRSTWFAPSDAVTQMLWRRAGANVLAATCREEASESRREPVGIGEDTDALNWLA
ncbi:MAG: hypothetical protein ACRDHS_13750 [Actinomycetota bacterium]